MCCRSEPEDDQESDQGSGEVLTDQLELNTHLVILICCKEPSGCTVLSRLGSRDVGHLWSVPQWVFETNLKEQSWSGPVWNEEEWQKVPFLFEKLFPGGFCVFV